MNDPFPLDADDEHYGDIFLKEAERLYDIHSKSMSHDPGRSSVLMAVHHADLVAPRMYDGTNVPFDEWDEIPAGWSTYCP